MWHHNDRVRVGVFDTIDDAQRAVGMLRDAGFTVDEITVVTAHPRARALFRAYRHQEPAGTTTPWKATLGAVLGAGVAGAAVVTAGTATQQSPLLMAAAIAVLTGAVVGGFIGAMLARGVEHELADFADQAMPSGRILVAAKDDRQDGRAHLAQAERALSAAGAAPISLPDD